MSNDITQDKQDEFAKRILALAKELDLELIHGIEVYGTEECIFTGETIDKIAIILKEGLLN